MSQQIEYTAMNDSQEVLVGYTLIGSPSEYTGIPCKYEPVLVMNVDMMNDPKADIDARVELIRNQNDFNEAHVTEVQIVRNGIYVNIFDELTK
jgi:hypothetical protein